MVSLWVILFVIGYVVAVSFIAYFIFIERTTENSNSAEVLDELDQVCQEANKKAKSIKTKSTKVKSFKKGPIETDPIPQNILQAFKGISEE